VTISDRDRWNERYRDAEEPTEITPPELVGRIADSIRPRSRVLDVACGFGDAGLFLAQRGCDVTLTDVSQVALDHVMRRARSVDVAISTACLDLTNEPLPAGPWDVIICVHYLDREVLPRLASTLRVGGVLVVAVATITNLERHKRPSARFLLEEGELASLVPGLDVVRHDETWRESGTHEAWLVGELPGAQPEVS
jgi:tellurite methyltransferase